MSRIKDSTGKAGYRNKGANSQGRGKAGDYRGGTKARAEAYAKKKAAASSAKATASSTSTSSDSDYYSKDKGNTPKYMAYKRPFKKGGSVGLPGGANC